MAVVMAAKRMLWMVGLGREGQCWLKKIGLRERWRC